MNTFSNCGDNEKIIADADTDNKEIEMEMVEMAVELPVEMLELTLLYLSPDILITVLTFYGFRMYHSVWRFASRSTVPRATRPEATATTRPATMPPTVIAPSDSPANR